MKRTSFAARLVLLGTLLVVWSGCMAIDEIDKAQAKMPKTKASRSAQTEATAPAEDDAADRLLQQSKRWWNQAKSLSPSEAPSSIVQCRLSGGTQFMARDDCLARGGTASAASG